MVEDIRCLPEGGLFCHPQFAKTLYIVKHYQRAERRLHPSQFQFAVVSDRAANPRVGVFENALKKVGLMRPDFVLSVGDFIHGYATSGGGLTDEETITTKRDNIDAMLDKLPMRFYLVPGNHDINRPCRINSSNQPVISGV